MTHRLFVALLAVCTLMGHSFARAQDSAKPAPKPVRLVAEAEDFTIKSGEWKVVPYRENYYASTFAMTFLSRMACLGAPEQTAAGKPAVAEQVVTIPEADEYDVLARFEQPFNWSVEFTIEIEQNGKAVYKQFYGRIQDPKIWPLTRPDVRIVPMERFWWGGTDNIVWQNPGKAKLAAGPATIRLIADTQSDGGKPRVNAAQRHVDAVILTNDAAGSQAQMKTRYLPFDGWLTQDGDLYVRVTNPAEGAPCIVSVDPYTLGQHSPYYVHTRDWAGSKLLKSGLLQTDVAYRYAGPRSARVRPELLAPTVAAEKFMVADPKRPTAKPAMVIPEEEYLQPGQTSGWVPIGHMIDSLNNSKWIAPSATYKAKGAELNLKVEFGVPDGKGGVRVLRDIVVRGKPEIYEIPGNIAPGDALANILKERYWLPEIRSQREALAWVTEQVKKFPKHGKAPDRFLIYNILGFGMGANFVPEGPELAAALGDNTMIGQQGKKRGLVAHWRDVSPKFYEAAKVDDVKVISYGDEVHLPVARIDDAQFQEFLKARGVPIDDTTKLDTKDRANRWYYYSYLASIEAGAKPYIAASAHYASKGALTGANYSPHANYLVTEKEYIRPFKLRAMTMPWSEDYVWQIPEFSVQITGYLVSAFRAGAKYHNDPIHMYILPHSPGNTPRSFRISFYTAVAHGSKMINYFCASPLAVGGTENYIDTNDVAMWRAIHDTTFDAGVFEDYVLDAKVRPAKVGLLLSPVDEIITGVTNSTLAMHNNERKAVYYALRHAQVPVDFLSEDDVLDGYLNDYKVLYVTQQYLGSKTLAALQKWVESGGTLVALCGGGFKNEFNEPNPNAATLYGATGLEIETDPQLVPKYLIAENKPFLSKQDLPLYVPIDTVSWNAGSDDATAAKAVPVIVWKQKLAATDGKVIGTFADGGPAVITKSHGKGKTYLFGFLPGQAYLKSALPIRPPDRGAVESAYAHFIPTDMDRSLRARLVDDFASVVSKQVTCDPELVETTCIDTPAANGKPARLAVPLINYTGKAIDKVTVRIADLPKATAIRSVQQGELKPRFDGGAAIVELKLDAANILLIDR